MSVMLDVITSIVVSSPQKVRVYWTSLFSNWLSWIFVDGALAAGPIMTGETARSALVELPAGRTAQIEVHSIAEGDPPAQSTRPVPNVKPQSLWAVVASAARYHVYRRRESELTEKLIGDLVARPEDEQVSHVGALRLVGQGGQWYFERVESVDAAGQESTRASWSFLVREPPAPVKVSIEDGSAPGLFTLTIGA